ncbi:protein containg repeat domain [Longilinea arvoryzae]|uniref:Protein containg repeat domain n=1 Tax=Longilinea arvoryzae TaxID=360412 RepID=A0A0K8MXG7_9CHLR|nr:FG-GAP-like repeat-containing protein [Longilinea arvoryzae]GAP15958.1 protein containg repeat domain [Longilinea arvoryzae]
MRKKLTIGFFILVLSLAIGSISVSAADGTTTVYLPLVSGGGAAPAAVLKWSYGGCYASWCETGWYSSPAVLDIDADGINEILASAYSVWALEGQNGALDWRVGDTSQRTWPGVVVADLDRDGQSEIVVAQAGGRVTAYRPNGSVKWQKEPSGGTGEFRGLLVTDLDGNGSALEVIVTRAYGSAINTWVLDANGNTRAGWPQLPNDTYGYAWGVYNANAAAGDISGDSRLELIVPSDMHYINAFEPNGSALPANATIDPGKYWGQVGVWESILPEKRGWGACDGTRAESYRSNFADGPAAIADLDSNGTREVVVTGNMYDCSLESTPSRYIALYIFNADRSRFNTGGYDWTTIPVDTGAPISEDYNVIETAQPNPVIADLDGDGRQEILFASYDGRLHAFWLDKTEHGDWPYSVYNASEGIYRFASEPVVADLYNDGTAEVIFTSWTQIGSNQYGRLHILDSNGNSLFQTNLPAPRSSSATWNGGLAAPTLANVDADADLEVVINTATSGVVVYDLPGTSAARILWGTGRGSYRRDAVR